MSAWDNPLFFAVVIACMLSVLAVVVLWLLGMSIGNAIAAGGLCWAFGTVAALSGKNGARRL